MKIRPRSYLALIVRIVKSREFHCTGVRVVKSPRIPLHCHWFWRSFRLECPVCRFYVGGGLLCHPALMRDIPFYCSVVMCLL